MKRNFLKATGLAALMIAAVSCKNQNEVEATEAADEATATEMAVVYNVDTEASNIEWTGSKIGGSHNGVIGLSDGVVTVNGEALESGEFTIDMTSIEVLDLAPEEGGNSLNAHLQGTVEGKETDFFNTPKYPTAQFVVTGLNGNTLEGNLTLKDVTKNVSFPVAVSYDGDTMMLTSEEFTIDRTDWGITYGSASLADTVKDKAISDDMVLKVNLVAVK